MRTRRPGKLTIAAAFLIGAAMLATAALADPCKVIPDKGPLPSWLHKGAVFSGPVGAVLDGDSICLATPSGLVEVRVADFYAPELHEPGGPEAKATAQRLFLGRNLTCRAQHRSYDRIVARCTLNGQSVGDLMRAAGVPEGGRGFR